MARLVNRRWQADAIVDGKRVRPKFDTYSEAVAWEADPKPLATITFFGDKPVNTAQTVTQLFHKAYELYWKGTPNQQSAYSITKMLIDEVGPDASPVILNDTKLTDMVLNWKTVRKNSTKTMNRKLACLSKITKLIAKEFPDYKPPEIEFKKEAKGRVRFLTSSEEARLRASLSDDYERHFFDFLCYTGCRYSEAIKLKWSDINWKGRNVTFWETKGGEPRTIPLSNLAYRALEHAKKLRDNQEGPWDLNYNTFNNHWQVAKKEAKLAKDKQVVPHVLRHTCLSRLVQAGVDIRRVKEWAGHSDIKQTMIYAHLAPNSLDSAVSALDAACG